MNQSPGIDSYFHCIAIYCQAELETKGLVGVAKFKPQGQMDMVWYCCVGPPSLNVLFHQEGPKNPPHENFLSPRKNIAQDHHNYSRHPLVHQLAPWQLNELINYYGPQRWQVVSLLGLGGSKIPHTSIMHFRWDSHNHVLDQIVTKNHVCGFGKKIQLCLDKCDDANEKNLCDVGHMYRLMPLAFLPYPHFPYLPCYGIHSFWFPHQDILTTQYFGLRLVNLNSTLEVMIEST